MLMDLSDVWIDVLLPEVDIGHLNFRESWEYPENPLDVQRISTILSSTAIDDLYKFYGCISAENIHQFPPKNLNLYLSVTDVYHAKRIIEAISQQKRSVMHLIAMHIRCEEVWPRIWALNQPERTHRPSLLLISDADDNKTSWIVEAAIGFGSR